MNVVVVAGLVLFVIALWETRSLVRKPRDRGEAIRQWLDKTGRDGRI